MRSTHDQIPMVADGRGRPHKLILTSDQHGDAMPASALLKGLSPRRILADKAYDGNALRSLIAGMGVKAVIHRNSTRRRLIPYDAAAYKVRDTIERCFNAFEHFRRIATRFDRRAVYNLGFLPKPRCPDRDAASVDSA